MFRCSAICRVCGDRASGRHYGVQSCDGCRGFFKRSIRRRPNYECREENRCVIDMLRRNQCQACRFRKCLAVSMNPHAVQHQRRANQHSLQLEDAASSTKQKKISRIIDITKSPRSLNGQAAVVIYLQSLVQSYFLSSPLLIIPINDRMTVIRSSWHSLFILNYISHLVNEPHEEINVEKDICETGIAQNLSLLSWFRAILESLRELKLSKLEIRYMSIAILCKYDYSLFSCQTIRAIQHHAVTVLGYYHDHSCWPLYSNNLVQRFSQIICLVQFISYISKESVINTFFPMYESDKIERICYEYLSMT